jgi:hypothetical protein
VAGFSEETAEGKVKENERDSLNTLRERLILRKL